MMAASCDERGKLSLDMLIGLSIFLVTFIFIAQFLPTVFADVRREISLAHEAYKVTVMLAEMEGGWKNSTHNGTDWENYDVCNDSSITFLPGMSGGEPDFIKLEKALAFNKYAKYCTEKFRQMLGLNVSNTHFHVSIESLSSTPYSRYLVKYDNSPLLDAGDPLPGHGNVVKFERFIWLRPNPSLIGVLFINTERGAMPTPVCQPQPTGGDADCRIELTYPLTEISVTVFNTFGNAPAVSICFYSSKPQNWENPQGGGACPLGDRSVKVIVDSQGNKREEEIPQSLPAVITDDFLNFVNEKLGDAGLKDGGKVYIKISVRQVESSIVILDKTSPRYIAGKAAAKMVVYVW